MPEVHRSFGIQHKENIQQGHRVLHLHRRLLPRRQKVDQWGRGMPAWPFNGLQIAILMCASTWSKWLFTECCYCSVTVVFNSWWPCGPRHARLPSASPFPGVCSNSSPLSQRCHPAASASVVPFPSCPQSFPGSGSFLMSQLFTSGGRSAGLVFSPPLRSVTMHLHSLPPFLRSPFPIPILLWSLKVWVSWSICLLISLTIPKWSHPISRL